MGLKSSSWEIYDRYPSWEEISEEWLTERLIRKINTEVN
ncbi:hypothetical protein LINPERHAP1_LOCUS31701 [Linum perenne]